jgi:membrane associated rhomboid family serine protease
LGIYDRDYYRPQQRSGFSFRTPSSVVVTLIVVNAAIWLVDGFTGGRLSHLMATRVGTLTHPWLWWQFLTAGFAHDPRNIVHLLGNMFVLYFLGRSVEERYGSAEFLRFYLVTLVFANVAWAAIGNLTGEPAFAGVIGASGAITGVLVLFAFNFPNVTILAFFVFPMPAWLFGVLVEAYDLYGALHGNRDSNVAYVVHIAGAAFAALYYQAGWNFGRLGFRLPLPTSPFGKKPRLRVVNPPNEQSREPESDLTKEVDRILAKISSEGEASLTPQERRTLESASREYQRRRQD